MAAVIPATAAATGDGRSSRAEPCTKFSILSRGWSDVQAQDRMDGWFQRNFRSSQGAFELIVRRVEIKWSDVNDPLHHNAVFSIKDRVAVTLHYLTHSGGFAESGQVFGISESRAHCYVGEVVSVILLFLQDTIHLPQSVDEWTENALAFEHDRGFPNAVGAIDGSLVQIKLFNDHEGWYCREGFPAFNIQAVVNN
ncbi:hypothetical protein Ae201684_014085 [Aphanomyces euteiches]|uniref:DDE Tnp4 domain-containing protein n=1 Tax=Aphanomyces euteiches TaxID=100861 RepID=A0A6G0WL13_9STRA|nr:hypothetical protein Ae201684_014085 [Aphanomyces euteiches]